MNKLLLAIGLLVTNFSLAQKIQLINSGDRIQEAIAAYDSGNYEGAISTYLTVQERDTNYVYMLSELARAYTDNKQHDKAIETCDKALKNPGIYRAAFLRTKAFAIGLKGDFDQSVALFNKIIDEYPTDYVALFFLGNTYYNHHDYVKARDTFFKALTINPFHAGSHLNLGRLSIGEGRKVHGMLSLGVYLALNNRDNSRLVLLNDFVTNQVKDDGSLEINSPNVFDKLDQIIRARLALEKSFKSAFPVDAGVVKQFELLFQQLNTVSDPKDDQWAKVYLPLYNEIIKQNKVEAFIYHILSSSKIEAAAKWNRKNEKVLKSFYSVANSALSQLRLFPDVPAATGFPKGTSGWYDSDNRLVALGNKNKDGKKEGRWVYYFDNGQRSAEGKYNAAEVKIGTWSYYFGNGNIKSIENYETGERTTFYFQGGKYQHYFEKNDKVEGPAEIYYPCGSLREKVMYKDGKAEGAGETYFVNGKVEKKYHYSSGDLDGEYTTYYADGKIQSRYTNRQGKAEGLYTYYSPEGRIIRKGEYSGDEMNGPWKYYQNNGKIDREGSYRNGTGTGEWLFYNRKGELIERRFLGEDGKVTGDNTFYHNDKPYLVYTYNKGMTVKATYYDPEGKVLGSSGKPDGNFPFKSYYRTGELNSEGQMKKGETHGKVKYYYRHGGLRSEFTYDNGVLEGEGIEYFKSGSKKSVANYVKGQLHGYYRLYYENRQVKEEGWFQEGKRQQQWLTWYPDGKLEDDSYYLNDEIVEEFKEHAVDGRLIASTVYKDGVVSSLTTYNARGEVNSTEKQDGRKRTVVTRFANGKPKGSSDFVCGKYEGEMKRWYPDGSQYITYSILNGQRHGLYRYYGVLKNLESEGRYLYGSRDGVWKGFYDDGKPEYTGYYNDNDADSVWTYFHPHGKVSSIVSYADDERNGLTVLNNADGTPAIEKLYESGDLISYRVMQQGGQWGEWKKFTGAALITAFYPAGGKAFEEEYKNGLLNGSRKVYFSNGKLYSEQRYVNGDYQGPYSFFYPNGKIREKGEYKDDEFNGVVESYNEDGSPRLSETYINGVRNGKLIIYTKGAKPKEFSYWGGMADE